MQTSLYDKLVAGHHRVGEMARGLAELCDRSPPPDPAALALARWDFSRTCIEHIAFKDRYVYINLESSEDPSVRATIRSLVEEQEQLHVSFRDHMVAWSTEAVAADFQGFRRAMAHMHEVLDRRMKREERELHPLARNFSDELTRQPARRNWARASWEIQDAMLKA